MRHAQAYHRFAPRPKPRILGWIGFFVLSALILTAALVPVNAAHEYDLDIMFRLHEFRFGWNVSLWAVGSSAFKPNHVASFTLVYMYAYALVRKRKMLSALGISFLLSVVIEVAQGFVPTRTGQLQDVIGNVVGTYLGIIAMFAYREFSAATSRSKRSLYDY